MSRKRPSSIGTLERMVEGLEVAQRINDAGMEPTANPRETVERVSNVLASEASEIRRTE